MSNSCPDERYPGKLSNSLKWPRPSPEIPTPAIDIKRGDRELVWEVLSQV